MRLSWRKWAVPAISWVAVLALAGMAIAGAEGEDVEPSATLSPAEVIDGVTLESGGTLDITLDLTAEPETEYGLTVSYGGDPIGMCQTDAATLTTDADGAAQFVCTFTAVENAGSDPLTGALTFTVALGGETVTENVASLTVDPAEEEEPEEPEETEVETEDADGINHGHCVSYWAHEAKAQGLSGRSKGAFVSSIAQDEEAVSSKVPEGGEPDDTCDFSEELAEALAAQGTDGDEASGAARGQERSAAAKAKGPKGAGDDADDTGEDA